MLNRAADAKVKRAALTAIAMLPAESSRALYQQYLHDKDDKLRAAAAEGYARLRIPRTCRARAGVAGRNEDLAAALAGFRAGDAGEDGDQRVQSAAVSDQQSEFGELSWARRFRFWWSWRAMRQCGRRYTRRCRPGPRRKKSGSAACWRVAAISRACAELQKLTRDPDTGGRQGSPESRADAAGEVGWGRPGGLPAMTGDENYFAFFCFC